MTSTLLQSTSEGRGGGSGTVVLPATDPGSAAGASGVYTEGTATYASTIDSALTALKYGYCYDNGAAAALGANMPLWVEMHSIFADKSELTNTDRRRIAARGYLVLVVDMRGRGGSSGTQDLSGRETYDILDAMTDARSRFPTVAAPSATSADVVHGVSGGGGSSLAACCRAPDSFVVCGDVFGISDYGYDLASSWWFDASSTNHATLTTWVGDPTAATPADKTITYRYRARNLRESAADAFKFGGYFYSWHNTSDTTVPPEHTRLVHNELDAYGLTNHLKSESASQWAHGIESTVPDTEWLPTRRQRLSTAWSVPVRAFSWTVLGFLKTKRFEVWVGPNANPKTDSSGGTTHVARINYDTVAGVYEVRHVDGPLPMYVQVIDGATNLTGNVAADQGTLVLRRNDPTLSVPAATLDLRVQVGGSVHVTGSAINTWDDQSGNALNFTGSVGNEPQYVANDGDAVAAITFNGTSQRFRRSGVPIDLNGDFTFCFVFYATANGWIWTSDASGDNVARLAVTYNSGFEVTFKNDANTGVTVAVAASLNAWHFVTVKRSAGTLSVTCDGNAGTTASAPASPITPNGATIGCWTANAGVLDFWHGKLRWAKGWSGTALSAAQIAAERTLAQADCPGLP